MRTRLLAASLGLVSCVLMPAGASAQAVTSIAVRARWLHDAQEHGQA